MKTIGALVLTSISSALAAPAIVWQNAGSDTVRTVRTSKSLKAPDLLDDVLSLETQDSALAAVVFLLGRNADGSESLSELAASNSLPKVAVKYDNADAIHHHVEGIKSASSIVQDSKVVNSVHNVHSVSLAEFNSIATSRSEPLKIEVSETGVLSKEQKSLIKRASQIKDATVLVVEVDPTTDPAEIDNIVSSTIENSSVATVVLTSVRSHNEVKLERRQANRDQQRKMEAASRRSLAANHRRLEAEENDDGQQDADDNEDLTGIYYVSMTPNIMAGLLFWLLFSVVAFIGISCMGMIAGQDVYVKKMPAIGREA